MAAGRPVIETAEPPACPTQTRIITTSDEPDHLVLIWSYLPPVVEPIYVLRRGILMTCGWKDVLRSGHCVQQQETGATLIHTFNLGTIPAGSLVYYLLTRNCIFTTDMWTTPIYRFHVTTPGAGSRTCYGHLTVNRAFFPAVWANPPLTVKDCDPDNMLMGASPPTIAFDGPGTWRISIGFNIDTRLTGGNLSLRIQQQFPPLTIHQVNLGFQASGQLLSFVLVSNYSPAAFQTVTWQGFHDGPGAWNFTPGTWVQARPFPP